MNTGDKKVTKAIEKYRDSHVSFITYNELEDIPLNEKLELSEETGAIVMERITSSDEEGVSFRVKMQKGEILKNHFHNCKETILVYTGALKDMSTKEIKARLNYMTIPPFIKHEIKAIEESVFYVEFKKPE